jgi:HK97 gp10 family phage protein
VKVEANVSQEDIDILVTRLNTLSYGAASRASRKAIRAGLRVLRDAMKQMAPVKSGQLRRSLGERFRKVRRGEDRGIVEAKVGLNVGKKKRSKTKGGEDRPNDAYAPHAHLVTLGTQDRWRGVKYGRVRARKGKASVYDPSKDAISGRLAAAWISGKGAQSVKFVGRMKPNPFVRWASQRVASSASKMIRDRLKQELDVEINRLAGGATK